jgi:hypothetical protein
MKVVSVEIYLVVSITGRTRTEQIYVNEVGTFIYMYGSKGGTEKPRFQIQYMYCTV